VLLAEDDRGVRTLARAVLQHGGYTVREAADGEEALRLCRQSRRPVQLLLTDAVMPNMSGPELARRVRELQPAVKVLFISGYTEDTLTRHGAGAAGLAFLPKPFTTQALAAKVREVLDGPG
jgi:two-component system, cell cycle sensor histidine kinase and response regulator CckA